MSDEPKGLEIGPEPQAVASTPDLELAIEDLDLSERPRNCLKRAQVNTVGELLLAGYALAYPSYETGFAERGLYVADLYTGPAYRRQGVARALLSAVARAGHARGVRHLWLTARTANRAAHAFYRRLGGRGEAVVAFAVVEQDFNNLAAEQPR